MIGEPWFWRERTLAARAASLSLAPAALIYDAGQRVRAAMTRPVRAPVPVFCVGNATLGGVGKTPFAIMLAERLKALGYQPHFLMRGYGGSLSGPVRVDGDGHGANEVGDEALLLAAAAPTWVSRDRPAGAKAAAAAGAEAIVMDDGFQNPSLEKTFSFLLIDAADPFGNARLFPAGPLREPPLRAAARAGALVTVTAGENGSSVIEGVPSDLPKLRAWLEATAIPSPGRAAAFCGIGRPQRFFDLLTKLGFDVAARWPFPDHHRFSEAEIARLKREAAKASATLVTTEKDFARLPVALRDGVTVLPVSMRIDDPARLDSMLSSAIAAFAGQAGAGA
ncbi:MAG: tetraacyldisaccharide 4'-kinase [Pseudomonadota bacterium]|nr:tetraacyldisaccharide 4'-kinase [Pseudomonadota bacterium]